jgi:hypothetical protein
LEIAQGFEPSRVSWPWSLCDVFEPPSSHCDTDPGTQQTLVLTSAQLTAR